MPKHKPHVLVIPSWYKTVKNPYAGCFFQEQVEELRKQGCRIGIVAPHIFLLKEWRKITLSELFQKKITLEEDVPHYRFFGLNFFPKWPYMQMRAWVKKAVKLAEEYIADYGTPDLIHAHATLYAGVAAEELSQRFSIPYILTEHRSYFPAKAEMEKEPKWLARSLASALNHSKRVIAVSHALKDLLAGHLEDPKKLAVIPHFFSEQEFEAEKPLLPVSPFRFFTLCDLRPRKNLPLLLNAFADAFRDKPDVHLEIGGDGPDRRDLEALSQRLGLQSQVRFLGRISHAEKKERYLHSHAFVLPSLHENFGVVFIEALASGEPVITTKCGGAEDIVNDKVGKIIPAMTPECLSAALLHMHSSYKEYSPSFIRCYARENFGSEKVGRQIISLYQEILSSKKA